MAAGTANLNLRFRKKMTGFIGGLFILGFLLKSTYLAFWPTPWTEYVLEGASDRYQFDWAFSRAVLGCITCSI